MTDTDKQNQVPLRDLVFVIGSIAAITASYGITYPLLSALIELEGLPGTFNGFAGAMTAVGTLVAGPVAPKLLRRYSPKGLISVTLLLGSLIFLLFPPTDKIVGWTALRFLLGFMDGIAFIASETWISSLANDRNRGRIMGFYGAALAGGFAVGPFMVQVTGIHGSLPFIMAFCLVAGAVLPLQLAGRNRPDPDEEVTGSLFSVFRIAPLPLIAGGYFALTETSAVSLLAPYALRLGVEENMATLLVGILVIGSVVSQIPAGMAADRFDKRLMLALSGIGAALVIPAFPMAISAGLAGAPVLMLWGALFAASYPAGLAMVGERFGGQGLATAMAAFAMAYSLGSMIGPFGAGASIDVWNPHGLMLWMGGVSGLFGLYALWRYILSKRSGDAKIEKNSISQEKPPIAP